MTKNRLGSVCGALPWKLDMRSSTFAVICNAQNLSTGIVLECTGTPTQKTVMNYIIQCANLMPEAVELLGKCAIEMQKRCDYCAGKDGRACIGCSNSEMRTEIHALLAKLEGGADDERD